MSTKIRPLRLVTAVVVAALVAGLVGGGARATDEHGDHHGQDGQDGRVEHAARPDHAASAEDGDRPGHGDHHESEAPSAFGVADFERRGVTVATAAAGTVDVGVDLPGEVRANADRLAHLAPRFPGLVREVRKRVGDTVRTGEVLAVIESETLASFELKAAFDGVVIDRHVVPGEAVGRDTPAFIVADLSSVWIDVHVYQSALADLHLDQPVRVVGPAGAIEAEGTVSYIAPVVEQATRTASARVVLPNPTGAWRPGLFVNVTVLTPIAAPVVVPSTALHRFEDATTIFVVDGERFVPRQVTVGRTGRTKVAITAGLAPGERYAEGGSFLVKAELAKGEAGHEH
ncbi:MAG: efflux RND transporter periplasmic adaptor subunit [Candidatus Binatia bacterium]